MGRRCLLLDKGLQEVNVWALVSCRAANSTAVAAGRVEEYMLLLELVFFVDVQRRNALREYSRGERESRQEAKMERREPSI